MTRLETAKEGAETELDRNFDQTLELLKQSFLQAVRQAHVLYGGLPTSSTFDIENEVYEGRIMPTAEARAMALATKERLAPTKGG